MGLDSTLRSLPQIILVQTNTINVALIPNPIIVVIKFIPELIIFHFPILKKKNTRSPQAKTKMEKQQQLQQAKQDENLFFSSFFFLVTKLTGSKILTKTQIRNFQERASFWKQDSQENYKNYPFIELESKLLSMDSKL